MKDSLVRDKDFLMKEITRGMEYRQGTITVTRTRTSDGFAAITIRVDRTREEAEGGKTKPILRQTTKFAFTNEGGNNGYEQQALELAKLIRALVSDPCDLPEGQ